MKPVDAFGAILRGKQVGNIFGNKADIFFSTIDNLAYANSDYRFLIGDFNFIDAGIDTSADSPNFLPESSRTKWANLLTKLKLKEIHQDDHTYYHISGGTVKSSRIDRIYASFSEADWEMVNPSPRVHPLKNININSLSQHMPLGLTYELNVRRNIGSKIPDWVVQDDRYIDMVASRCSSAP